MVVVGVQEQIGVGVVVHRHAKQVKVVIERNKKGKQPMITIKVEQKHKAILKKYSDKAQNTREAFEIADRCMRLAGIELTKKIKELHPEVDGMQCEYDSEKNVIKILGKENSPCKKS